MAQDDLDAEYHALSPAARMYSTNHPHVFYWTAGIECVGFAVLGFWMMTRSVGAGIAVIAIAIVFSLFTAWPGHWSEKHPDEARRVVEIQRRRRNRMARRHPAYFLVLVPMIAADTAALRFNRDRHHPSTADWVMPATIGLAFGLAVGIVLVRRARNSSPT